jgi:hypothetical protein
VPREPLVLLAGVREVSAVAKPTDPLAVSQRAFDRARANSAAHADLPAARQIAKELKLNWPEALAVAHSPENEQNKLLALKTKDYYSPVGWLTDARIKYALRLVAGRLGVDKLTKGEYDAERVALLNADARDWLHGRRLRLPSANAILLAANSWDAAVVLAGLKAFVRSHTIHQVILSPVEVVDRFYEHYGEQPSRKALRAFARGNKLPMSGEGGRPFGRTLVAPPLASARRRWFLRFQSVAHRSGPSPRDAAAPTPGSFPSGVGTWQRRSPPQQPLVAPPPRGLQ